MANTDLGIRYMTVKLIFDGEVQPGALPGQSESFENGQNVKIITGNSGKNDISVNANIGIQGGLQPSTCSLVIKGLKDADIHAFSRININSGIRMFQNWVEIYAGYNADANGMPPLVYRGQVISAGADFNDKSRPFQLYSQQLAYNQNVLATPINPKGTVQINDLFQQLAANLGLTYQANNEQVYNKVTGTITNPVLIGSPIQQLNQLSRNYGYQFKIYNGQLLVSRVGQPYILNQQPAELKTVPPDGNTTSPEGNNLIQINKDTGMLGYPVPSEFGITVRTRFNPNILFGIQVNITSDLTIANGVWWVNGMSHVLQNQESKFETVLTLNKTSVFLSN